MTDILQKWTWPLRRTLGKNPVKPFGTTTGSRQTRSDSSTNPTQQRGISVKFTSSRKSWKNGDRIQMNSVKPSNVFTNDNWPQTNQVKPSKFLKSTQNERTKRSKTQRTLCIQRKNSVKPSKKLSRQLAPKKLSQTIQNDQPTLLNTGMTR